MSRRGSSQFNVVCAGLAWALALAAATVARADVDLFSPGTIAGLVDLRMAAADGEKSWTKDAFGKSRYGGDPGGGWKLKPQLAEVAAVWKPRLSWDLGAVVHVQHQPEQEEHPVDLVEAYLNWKPTPRSSWRYTARAGLFFPPISLEHQDPAWGVTHTITPSAINSWVGEEVKVLGLEGQVSHSFGSGDELGATVALFGYNDTAGTLLSLRGWGIDDVKGTAFGELPLPALLPQYQGIWRGQDADTYPVRELDSRIGAYGRIDWRTAGPAAFNLFYYDNGGNRTSVRDGQWSWDTKFWNLGASLNPDKRTEILAQAVTGRTLEGYPTPVGVWIDVSFRSAYLLASRSYGKGAFAGRVEYFETIDHTFQMRDDNNEHGWALTGAYRYELTPNATLKLEAQHIASNRLARTYHGDAPHQDQTVLQSSLKLHF